MKVFMEDMFSRTELLIGKENIEKLQKSKVAVFGIGGVGSYVVEGLARAGIGNFILVDSDDVSISNLNRQIIATTKTIGKPKVEVAKDRILEINPNANVTTYKEFYMPDNRVPLEDDISYIVDAIDTVTAKIDLIEEAEKLKIPIISSMGTGNKLDPTKFEVTDIYKTSVCPLAKVMRKELRDRGIKKLKVVYSKEEPIKIKDRDNFEKDRELYKNEVENEMEAEEYAEKKNYISNSYIPGSISFVPSVAGLIIAGEVIKDIINV